MFIWINIFRLISLSLCYSLVDLIFIHPMPTSVTLALGGLSNISILYTVGNDFSPRVIIWGSYLSFGLSPLSKFCQFVSKCVFWIPSSFVANQGYPYDRVIESNLLEAWDATHGGRRRRHDDGKPWPSVRASASSNDNISHGKKVAPAPSMYRGLHAIMRACWR